MTRIRVEVTPPYDVVVVPGARAEAGRSLAAFRRVAIVSQARVADAYADVVRDSLDAESELFLMADGEAAKTLGTVEDLCRRFAAWGLLRGDAVVALGGGVVGDTAGFAAATYHRGIAVLQVPTTLLAMVDAAIGGKTAVNLPEGKNLVGAFHQPVGVLADTDTLRTLPDAEYRSGLGEVAKYTLMGDVVEDPAGLVDLLRMQTAEVLARDPKVLGDLVTRCARIKADVVARDPEERTGLHATLNLGHTFAHALETAGGYGLTHGEAVAIGLVFAGALAGGCERVGPDVVDRFQAVPATLGLLTEVPGGQDVDPDDLLALMRRDKKASGGLTFVLPGPDGIERVDDPPEHALRYAFSSVGIDAQIGGQERMATILLLSGPNLNLLGEREPEIYGTDTLEDCVEDARAAAGAAGYELEHFQSNHEGELIDAIHAARGRSVAIVFNPGAFTHSSYALADALAAFDGVKVELHLSNPSAREEWRRKSVVAPYVTGTVSGFGRAGYRLAVEAAVSKL